jgi:hypothetical protein
MALSGTVIKYELTHFLIDKTTQLIVDVPATKPVSSKKFFFSLADFIVIVHARDSQPL